MKSKKKSKELLTPKEAAEWLGIGKRLLDQWRATGTGPAYVRLSDRKVKYRLKDLAKFAASKLEGGPRSPSDRRFAFIRETPLRAGEPKRLTAKDFEGDPFPEIELDTEG